MGAGLPFQNVPTMNPLQLLNRITSLDIPGMAGKVLQEHSEVIADLNASQLAQGRRSDNSEILPRYSPVTIELKKGLPGLAGVTDRVTLFSSGRHYAELYFIVQGLKTEYGSRDSKSEKLEKKYGTARGSLYGLTDDNRQELINTSIKPKFYEEMRKQLTK